MTDARVPPHDLDAEAAVLGGVLYDPSNLSLVSWLPPEEFYSEANRRIWEAVMWLGENSKQCDPVQVAGRLRDLDRLGQVGGAVYLAELADKTPVSFDLEAYAVRIRELYRRRQLIRACQETAANAYDGKIQTPNLLSAHEQAIYELSRDDRCRQTAALGPIIQDVFTAIQTAVESGKDITGIETGFARLDELTAGMHEDELTVIAGRPGMGKTAFGLNVVRNIAMKMVDGAHVHGCVVFSLEMPREQLAARWVCGEARVFAQKLRFPKTLTNKDWDELNCASQDLYQLPIEIDDTPSIGLIEIAGKCRRCASKFERRGQRLSLVLVDYLQLARGNESGGREQEISSLSRGLKALSKQLHVPVIALSQLNRAPETRGTKEKRPQLSDLRESGAIEQDADNIIFIYRDDYYNKDSPKKGTAELIVAKQRNGPTRSVHVKFNAPYVRFDNLSPGECEDTEET